MRNAFCSVPEMAMSCNICGQISLPGAMLCRACKAALKRARNLSVQELPPPSQNRGTRSPRRPAGASTPRVSGPPTAVKRTGRRAWRFAVPVALAVAALGVVGYAGKGGVTTEEPVAQHSVVEPLRADARPAAASRLPAAGEAALTPVDALVAPPFPSTPMESKPRTQSSPTTATLLPALPARPPIGASRANTQAALREDVPPLAVAIAAPETPAPLIELPSEPAPPVIRAAPPRDRWQAMREQLAACAREGGLGGFICDQRTRLATCDGYWGRVEQCALPPENPRGQ